MKKWAQYTLVFVVFVCAYFIHVGADEVDTQEGYNWVAAREMVQDHHWIVPTMNEDPRIAKPPFPTWITAWVRMLNPDDDNGSTLMRIPAGFIAILFVFSIWGFMKLFSDDDVLPFLTAMIAATNVLVIVLGRRNSWCIYNNTFMMIGLWALSYGWSKRKSSTWVFIAAGMAMGLSFMSKWIVSFYVLLLPFLVAYIYSFGFEKIWDKKRQLFICAITCVIVGVAWPLYVLVSHPELSWFTSKMEVSAWSNEHVRQFYYYFNFPIFAGVWIIFFLSYFIKPFAQSRVGSYKKYLFPLVWYLLTVFLLMIIPEKKERFLLPASTPMSMMAAYILYSVIKAYKNSTETKSDRLLVNLHTLLLVVLTIAMPVAYFLRNKTDLFSYPSIGLVLSALVMVATVVFLRQRKRITGLFVISNILVCLFLVVLWPTISRWDHDNPEVRSLRQLKNDERIKGDVLYCVDPVHITAVWDIGEVAKIRKFKDSVSLKEKQILLFTKKQSILEFAEKHNGVSLTQLDEYKYDPKDSTHSVYVVLMEPKG